MTSSTPLTGKIRKIAAASLLALTLGSACLTTVALAGGSVSLSFLPTNSRDAQAMHTGLQLYSLFKDARSGAIVRQRGNNNEAGLGQFGRGNLGIIHQKGNGHSGTLQQHGDRNSYGLFQFGRNASGHVVQNGRGQAGTTFQFGW